MSTLRPHFSAANDPEPTVGFLGLRKLPVVDADELARKFESTAGMRGRLQEIGVDTPVGVDNVGRRVNLCGGLIDNLYGRLNRRLPGRIINLLHRCGYKTICDLSRDGRHRIETIPGIGPKYLSEINDVLAEHGLRFATYEETCTEEQLTSVKLLRSVDQIMRALSAEARQSSFSVVEGGYPRRSGAECALD